MSLRRSPPKFDGIRGSERGTPTGSSTGGGTGSARGQSLSSMRRETAKAQSQTTSASVVAPFTGLPQQFDPAEVLSILIEGTKGDFNALESNVTTLQDDVTNTLQELVLRHYSTFLKLTDDMHDLLHDVRLARKGAVDTRVNVASLCDATFDNRYAATSNDGSGVGGGVGGSERVEDIVCARRRKRQHKHAAGLGGMSGHGGRCRLIHRSSSAEGNPMLSTTIVDAHTLATACAVATGPTSSSGSRSGSKHQKETAGDHLPQELQATRDELLQLIFARQFQRAVDFLRQSLEDEKLVGSDSIIGSSSCGGGTGKSSAQAALTGGATALLEFEPLLTQKLSLEINRLPLSVSCMHPPLYNQLCTLGRSNEACQLFLDTQYRWLQWELNKALTVGSRRHICNTATEVWLIVVRTTFAQHSAMFPSETMCPVIMWVTQCVNYLVEHVLVPQLLCLNHPVALGAWQKTASSSSPLLTGSGQPQPSSSGGKSSSKSKSGSKQDLTSPLAGPGGGTPPPTGTSNVLPGTFVECIVTIAECSTKLKELAKLGFPHTFAPRIIAAAAVPLLVKQSDDTETKVAVGLQHWADGHPRLNEHRRPNIELVEAMDETRNECQRCSEHLIDRIGHIIQWMGTEVSVWNSPIHSSSGRVGTTSSSSSSSVRGAELQLSVLQREFSTLRAVIWQQQQRSSSSSSSTPGVPSNAAKSTIPPASLTFLDLFKGVFALLIPFAEQRLHSSVFRSVTDDLVLIEVVDASLQQHFRTFLTSRKEALEVAAGTVPEPDEEQDDDEQGEEAPLFPLTDLLDAKAPLSKRLLCTPFILGLLNDIIAASATLNFCVLFLKCLFSDVGHSTGYHLDKLGSKAGLFVNAAASQALFPRYDEAEDDEDDEDDAESFMMQGNLHRLVLSRVQIKANVLPSFSIFRSIVDASGYGKKGVLTAAPFPFDDLAPEDEAALFPLAVQFIVNTLHTVEVLRFAGCDSFSSSGSPRTAVAKSEGVAHRLRAYISDIVQAGPLGRNSAVGTSSTKLFGEGDETSSAPASCARTARAVGGSGFSDVTTIYLLQTLLVRAFEAMFCEPAFWELVCEGSPTPSTSQVILLVEVVRTFFQSILLCKLPNLMDTPAAVTINDIVTDYTKGSIAGRSTAMGAAAASSALDRKVDKLMGADIMETALLPDEDDDDELDEEAITAISLRDVQQAVLDFCVPFQQQ